MTASAINSDAAFSRFTFNLLLDTGWYTSIDFSLADEIQWGKNQGCGFFNLACKDTAKNYSEFSYTLNETKCSYDYNGVGAYSISDTFIDNCPFI